jgi:uncharacterized protein YecE (DUF72 family)
MIHVGTCSWTEKTLIQSGEFYPKGIRTAKDRLQYYAEHFDTVEVDSSYYAIPDEGTVSLWAERTPDNFIFHIKAYGALTGHGVDPVTLPKDIFQLLPEEEKNRKYTYIKDSSILDSIAKRFINVLSPLRRDNKLGVLVFQFPQWFHYNPANLEYILKCNKLMEGLKVAVEFRHGSWLASDRARSVFDFLKNNDLAYITADEPQYGTMPSVPFLPEATTDIAYFRFHGRNKENWLKKGIETSLRYSYFYSDDELKEFVRSIRNVDRKTKKTFVMFNNCHGGFAVRNSLRIKEMFEDR